MGFFDKLEKAEKDIAKGFVKAAEANDKYKDGSAKELEGILDSVIEGVGNAINDLTGRHKRKSSIDPAYKRKHKKAATTKHKKAATTINLQNKS